MDTVFELDEKLQILNITSRTPLPSSDNIALAIILGLLTTALAVGGLAASAITVAIITRTYLITSQIFRYVKLFALINIIYLSISLLIYIMKIFDCNYILLIALNLKPVFNFNLGVIISMLCLDRYVKIHFSDCYFYVFFFWCTVSVYIHDFSIIFQVGQTILHLIIVIVVIAKFVKYNSGNRGCSEEFFVFRLKFISLYVFLWLLNNILLFLLCYVFLYDVVIMTITISIMLTCICCVISTYMVYNCAYRYKMYFRESKEFSFENSLENNLLYPLESLTV